MLDRTKFRRIVLAVTLLSASYARAAAPPADADDVPVAGEPQAVPVVPLPPPVYGMAASVALIAGLCRTRCRHWLTLR